MNPAAAFLPKFFVVSSVILILSGVAQAFVRPRAPHETLAAKILNRATLTAIISVALGTAGLLIGLGVVPMPHLG